MAEEKEIKYLNKNFSDFKQSLIDFAKTYYPNTYNDFSESSPGTMFLDMASYIGDVLSFYQDTQFQELLVQYATEKENLYSLAYMLGYRPRVTYASNTTLDVFQLLPSTLSGSTYIPDYNYAMVIGKGSQIKTNDNSNIYFYVDDLVDFSFSSSFDPTTLSVYEINSTTNQPSLYLLKKSVQCTSGQIITTEINFGAPERFPLVEINDSNIIGIIDVEDSDGNKWYEVPYLAQETIFEELQNTSNNDPNTFNNSNSTPYLLKLKKVPRRFVARFKSNGFMELEFGPGISSGADEEIIPNSNNIGLGTIDGISKLNTAFDPSNFLYTNTYGIAPYNTTLTIKYLKGGGVESNVSSNTITDIAEAVTSFNNNNLDSSLQNTVRNSLSFNNPIAASGGGSGDTESELRLKTLASFSSQLRAVNKEDYIVRTLSMPSKYGSVSKAYIVQDANINANNPNDLVVDNNPLSLSLYVLGYNQNKQITTLSSTTKQNLKTYLSQYRMLNDAVNIKDAFFINLGINFEIMVLPNYNSKDVISSCILALKDYFNIDKWQINQPIIISPIYTLLDSVKGVQTVKKVEFTNISGTGYSQYGYDVQSATRNGIIYPSLDPSIFEIRNPEVDIKGRSVTS